MLNTANWYGALVKQWRSGNNAGKLSKTTYKLTAALLEDSKLVINF